MSECAVVKRENVLSNKHPYNDCLLLLTHIPKCAGTSFRYSVVSPNIESDLVFHPGKGWREIIHRGKDFRYLVGHFEVGVEQLIHLGNPARKRQKVYVTFLRYPLDQMISYYFFSLQQNNVKNSSDDVVANMIEYYSSHPNLQNLQTQYCSGFFINRLRPKNLLQQQIGALQLKLAMRNIRRKFDFVGCFETLDKDMAQLCDQLSFTYNPVHAEVTTTKHRPSLDDLSPAQRLQLETINHLDMKLYKYTQRTIWQQSRDE